MMPRLDNFHFRFARPFGPCLHFWVEVPAETPGQKNKRLLRNTTHLNDTLKVLGQPLFLKDQCVNILLQWVLNGLAALHAHYAHRSVKGALLAYSLSYSLLSKVGWLIGRVIGMFYGKHLEELHKIIWTHRKHAEAHEYLYQTDDIHWPLIRKNLRTQMNLETQDRPHDFAPIEWWYFNGTYGDKTNQKAFYISVFRKLVFTDKLGTPHHTMIVMGGVIDEKKRRSYPFSYYEPDFPTFLRHKLQQEPKQSSEIQALLKVLEAGALPPPDKVTSQKTFVRFDGLHIENPAFRLAKDRTQQTIELRIKDIPDVGDFEVHFQRPMQYCLHFNNGILRNATPKGEDCSLFYYFNPIVPCKIKCQGHVYEGSLWFDHEFQESQYLKKNKKTLKPKWIWFSLKTNKGRLFTAHFLFDQANKVADTRAVFIRPDGSFESISEVRVDSKKYWVSPETGRRYPVAFALKARKPKAHFLIEAVFPEQEVITILSDPAFWEGRVTMRSLLDDETGKGICEVFNYTAEAPKGSKKQQDTQKRKRDSKRNV